MIERVRELVLGMQRLGENVKLRGDDLRYNHNQENCDHIDAIDQLLSVVEKVHQTLLDERQRSLPVEPARDRVHHLPQDEVKIPRVVKQGPAA